MIQHIAVMLVLLISSVVLVLAAAAPEGPETFTKLNSTRRTPSPNASITGIAGNITELRIAGKTITQSWQGFVGNVTGTITLDDSAGRALYDWSLADPEGEVYATYLTYVDWSLGKVLCWNWTESTGTYLQLGEFEGWTASPSPSTYGGQGCAQDDVDCTNETFSAPGASTHSNFYVGEQLINGTHKMCPRARLYNGTKSGTFEEVLLYYEDTSTADGVVYTSILRSDANAYNNNTYDFEMVVAEDGHNGDATTTTFYFYVELE